MEGFSVFAGVGERTREGNGLYAEMKESKVIDADNFEKFKVALVYGQMNEPAWRKNACCFNSFNNGRVFRDKK
jgi:F-type H+-transporting ATPase subunit beta